MINQQTLELYIYVDGTQENDIPFFSGSYEDFILVKGNVFTTSNGKVFSVRALNEDIVIHSFTYNAKRMGAAPTITTTIKYSECLDELFSEKVYAIFNQEKYFLSAMPSSSYSNEEIMYKHEATFVSERIALENTYFYDVVPENGTFDKPVSNNSSFVISGDIREFANRLQWSLDYSNLDYTVVVDEGITSEDKFLSIENKFFSEVLQEVYNTYDIPYYFVGKEIHIGFTDNAIDEVFRYGDSDALMSITKANANNRTINRVTGFGSEENLPYYYPNKSPKGDIDAVANDSNAVLQTSDIRIVDYNKYANNVTIDGTIEYVRTINSINIKHRTENSLSYSSYGNQNNASFTISGDIGDTNDKELTFNLNCKLLKTDYLNLPSDGLLKIKPIIQLVNSGWLAGGVSEIPDHNPKFQIVIPKNGFFIGGYNSDSGSINISSKDGFFELPPIGKWSYAYSVSYVEFKLSEIKIIGSTNANYDIYVDWEIVPSGYWKYDNKEINLSDYGIAIDVDAANGDSFSQHLRNYITAQKTLMPPIYRESLGAERFYSATNNTHLIPDENENYTEEYYEFANEYNGHNPKEQIVQFDEIKPTIKGAVNTDGWRIDMFTEFAYDLNDNNETYETENGALEYKHPVFYGKLRKLGFNLFDHALDDGEMEFHMTNGNCSACVFRIAVDKDDHRTNLVQVDETTGELMRDDEGNVRSGWNSDEIGQPRQQDTINNEVWVALYKDKDTFGELYPFGDIKPKGAKNEDGTYNNDGDTFVITHINMPQEYIDRAEEQLYQQLIYFMFDNNTENFKYSIKFSRIYFAERPDILAQLNENARLIVEYDGIQKFLYVSSLTYKTTENDVLPEITVALADELSISQNSVQKATNSVKSELYKAMYGIDVVAQGSRVFLRKDQPDTVNAPITFNEKTILAKGSTLGGQISSKDYIEGANGLSIHQDDNGDWHIETDYLQARKKFSAKEVEIQKVYHICGAQIKSSASMVCSRVDDIGDAYRCWFNTIDDEGNTIYNEFMVGDQAYVQTFNLVDDGNGNTTNHFYWRLVESVSTDSIVLSKENCAIGSTIPMVGDHIVQLGYQGSDKPERQVAVIDAGAGEGAPYYRQFVGINSFELPNPETQLKPNDNILTGKLTLQSGSRGLDNLDEWSDKQQQIDAAQEIALNAKNYIDNILPQELQSLQNQLDGKVESYFGEDDPSLSTPPASEWIAEGTEAQHLNDTFTNTETGRSWRWLEKAGSYQWVEIADSQVSEALALASKALDTADGKRTIFVAQPTTPYQVGDLWVQGAYGRIKVCTTERFNGDYLESDWTNADNYKEYTDQQIAQYKDEVNSTIESLNKTIEDVEKAAEDYTDETKAALQTSIDALNEAKANINEVYTKSVMDNKISKTEEIAIQAAKEYADDAQAAAEETARIYADGIVDDEEQARLQQIADALETSKKYAEEKAEEAWLSSTKYIDEQISIANEAIARMQEWADDGVISPVEKQALKTEQTTVESDFVNIQQQYQKYIQEFDELILANGLYYETSDGYIFNIEVANINWSAYKNSYNYYIAEISSIINSSEENVPSGDLTIRQSNYYDCKKHILEDITLAIKAEADYSKTTAENAKNSVDALPISIEAEGAILSDFMGVKDDNNNIVAGINGGINNEALIDEDGEEIMIFAGADSLQNATTAKFKVTKDGKVSASGGDFSGTVYMDNGYLGGFIRKKVTEITSENINDVTISSDTYRVFNMSKMGGLIYLYIGGLSLQLPILANDRIYNGGGVTKDGLRQLIGNEIIIYNFATTASHLCGSRFFPEDKSFEASPTCYGLIESGDIVKLTCKLTSDSELNEVIYWEFDKVGHTYRIPIIDPDNPK